MEALAIKEALSWLIEKGWHNMVIECNCLDLIKEINHDGPVSWDIELIVFCILHLRQLVGVSGCYYDYRTGNKAADIIAKLVIRDTNVREIFNNPLPSNYTVLLEDLQCLCIFVVPVNFSRNENSIIVFL
jgi:hypothetical protein